MLGPPRRLEACDAQPDLGIVELVVRVTATELAGGQVVLAVESELDLDALRAERHDIVGVQPVRWRDTSDHVFLVDGRVDFLIERAEAASYVPEGREAQTARHKGRVARERAAGRLDPVELPHRVVIVPKRKAAVSEVEPVHRHQKGKPKRFGRFEGRRDHAKKAYVNLKPGQEINFEAEAN